jgi:hypothetical protein
LVWGPPATQPSASALALGFGGFDQGLVLGEADSSDFPVNVD